MFLWNAKSHKNIHIGAVDVDIYNSLALLTIDTNINQFIKVYHNFYKLQVFFNYDIYVIQYIRKEKGKLFSSCPFLLIFHIHFISSVSCFTVICAESFLVMSSLKIPRDLLSSTTPNTSFVSKLICIS